MKSQLHLCLLPVLIAGINLIPAGRVAAQTFTILHRFDGSDGGSPWASLIVSGNTLYGTASRGGSSENGTVFAINTDGTSFTNLHSFTATDPSTGTKSDGIVPLAGLVLSGGILYGTAEYGGSSGNGTVFAVGTNGTRFTTLHAFTGYPSDGEVPGAGLILVNNTLFGTTVAGGSSDIGTVFKLNTDGTGFSILHSFRAGAENTNGYYTNSDGVNPEAGLIISGNTLYGTAAGGGTLGNGTVFAVNINGTGFTNLHSFSAGFGSAGDYGTNSDGINPWAGLALSGNTLYGTAVSGGSSGFGTVFAVNTSGTGFKNLHSFTAGAYDTNGNNTNSDGFAPYAGLLLSGNTLYGTAAGGGKSDFGTVFAVSINGTSFKTLHDFAYDDGIYPFAGLVLSSNTLYGTASDYFQDFRNGTVFSLSLALSLPAIVCSTPLILECTDGAAVGTVHAEVEDTNGNPLEVVWTVDGATFQTNDIPSGGNSTVSNVNFTANFGLGEHLVMASASNGETDPVTCSTTVTVHDTTPPRIKTIVATPNVLWPPNHRLVPVSLKLEAVDNCDPSPMATIRSVTRASWPSSTRFSSPVPRR